MVSCELQTYARPCPRILPPAISQNVPEVNCCKLRLHKEPAVISQAVFSHKLLQTKRRVERNA